MYAPSAFRDDDPDRLCAFIAAHPLATLVVNGESGPLAAYAPLTVEREDGDARPTALMGHVARANPFWRAADGAAALVLFVGGDGYVSPSFYPSKARDGRVVPTWNYERVEVRGRVSIETDPAALTPYVDAPTRAMEQNRARPWTLNDAPDGFVARQLKGLVGVRIFVETISGARKLSQDRCREDFDGVRAGLRADGHDALAGAMDALSPSGS